MQFGIAVFPFLKTSGRIYLGGLEFRSTDDVDDLPERQRETVRDVAGMLFLKDDLRIASAAFAIIDPVNIDRTSEHTVIEHRHNLRPHRTDHARRPVARIDHLHLSILA